MNELEYNMKLERVGELMKLDPEKDTDEGRELNILVDQINAYEMEKFPEFFTRKLIEDFRGGMPDKCSFCNKVTHKLEPWEGGAWACEECARKEYEDAKRDE